MPNPWDNDPVVGEANNIGRPVIRKGPEPVKPDLPQGYGMSGDTAAPVKGLPTGFTTPESYRPMSHDEKIGAGLDPAKPFQVSSKGQITQIGGEGKNDAAQTPDPEKPFEASQMLDSLSHIRELARKPMALGNLAGHSYFQAVPIIGQNATDMAAALDQVHGDILKTTLLQLKQLSPNGATGFGQLSNKEGEALKASVAHLQQAQSNDEFIAGVDQAEQHYRRMMAYARGLNPEDQAVAQKYGIQLPNDAQPAIKDAGGHITQSNELPGVRVGPQIGASGTEQAVLDPQVAKIAPQLEKYLNADPKKVSNAQIIGFIRKNGIDLARFPDLISSMSKRGKGVRFQVDPYYNEPLKGTEKTRAEISASPVGAALAGAGDTASLGASPEIAGLVAALGGEGYSAGRREFKDKQNLIAHENPGATLAGNILGGLSTAALTAPKSFAGLVAQAGKQGAAYGGLSSDDPSIGGRVENALGSGLTNATAAALLNPALKGVGFAGGRAVNAGRRLLGTSAEDIADSSALNSLAAHAPTQDIPAMRSASVEQTAQGAEPSGVTVMDRAGQDYLGRQIARSPGARTAADEAVASAQAKLPAQLEQDFHSAIDDAAGGDKNVASFLKRPAREITADIQGLAGREYEAGIKPIADEKLTINDDLAEVLTHERVKGAIADALSSHTLSEETRQALRNLPRALQEASAATKPPSAALGGSAAEQVAAMQAKVREQTLKNIPLTVDAARNLATALDRTANRLADGSEGVIELGRLSQQIRQSIGDQYPEFKPVNDRYASRMRAKGALNDARSNFLGDGTGDATDTLAAKTARMSDEPGEPEYTRPNGGPPADQTKFKVSRPNQALPSEKQMAVAGAKEATTAAAKSSDKSAASTAEKLSTTGQKERNRMILGERASALETRSKAKAANVRTMERVQSGGTGDDTGGKVGSTMKAVANLGFHRGGAAVASALSGIRGLSAQDASRVTKILMDSDKTETVIAALDRAYGRRKARFIISRIGALAATANKRRTLPEEAVKGAQ